jgi:hypothetical protein
MAPRHSSPAATLDGLPGGWRPEPGAERRKMTIVAAIGGGIAACALLVLAAIVVLSPGPPSQNITVPPIPPVVATAPVTTVPRPAPATTPPTVATSTTTSSTSTTVATAVVLSPGTNRPATLVEAAAIVHRVPPPAGSVITTITVSGSDPTWAVESISPSSLAPPPTASSTTTPSGVGPPPIANVLVQEVGGVWQQVDVGRPLVACPERPPAGGVVPGAAPAQVTRDLAAFLTGCG